VGPWRGGTGSNPVRKRNRFEPGSAPRAHLCVAAPRRRWSGTWARPKRRWTWVGLWPGRWLWTWAETEPGQFTLGWIYFGSISHYGGFKSDYLFFISVG
jgi:hypothetical protein